MEENGHSSNNGRASHNIGRLGNLVRVTKLGQYQPFLLLFFGHYNCFWLPQSLPLECAIATAFKILLVEFCVLIPFFGSYAQENDDFFELISSKFLSDTRYPPSIQAASARLLLSCSLTWIVRLLYLLFSLVIVFFKFMV